MTCLGIAYEECCAIRRTTGARPCVANLLSNSVEETWIVPPEICQCAILSVRFDGKKVAVLNVWAAHFELVDQPHSEELDCFKSTRH